MMNKEKTKGKKEWRKAELTVLVRSQPEEAVLSACKGGVYTGEIQMSYSNCCGIGTCAVCTAVQAS
jgi:ferredoxin-like protein FixX